jgi:catechol 2,3-dioxygenase-like lactoylglutathione lyase family enzyme
MASTNLDIMIDFYTRLLEQKPQKYIANVYAEFHFTNVKLGIFQPKITHESEFSNSAKNKISLCVEVNELEEAIAHLNTIGYPTQSEINTASHGREIYAYDPDGNRIIFHQSK